MTCHSIQRGALVVVAISAMAIIPVTRAAAQSPAPGASLPATVPAPPLPALPLYRAPVIALVQPAAGGNVPQDKPVVVIRFAQDEANDAINARSLTVAVDGTGPCRSKPVLLRRY